MITISKHQVETRGAKGESFSPSVWTSIRTAANQQVEFL